MFTCEQRGMLRLILLFGQETLLLGCGELRRRALAPLAQSCDVGPATLRQLLLQPLSLSMYALKL